MDEPLVEAALADTTAGIPVLPLHHPPPGWDRWPGRRRAIRCSCDRLYCLQAGEHPLSQGGMDAASSEPAEITAWWHRHPAANIGLATGVRFDVDVDADTGPLALARLEPQAVPVGPVARTGSGRWQFFIVPSGQPSRILWGPAHGGWCAARSRRLRRRTAEPPRRRRAHPMGPPAHQPPAATAATGA